jgi:hypothetical protein
VLLIASVELGYWISPLGGLSWGPRLLIPWIPALVALALAAAPERFDALARRATSGTRPALASAAVLLVLGLPHLATLVDSAHEPHPYPGWSGRADEVVFRQYAPDSSCPRSPDPYYDPPGYYRCQDHFMWTNGFALAQSVHAFRRPDLWVYSGLFALALAALALGCAHGTQAEARADRARAHGVREHARL